MTVTIKVPGRVWWDALDPLASQMQAELELGEPRRVRRGRGETMIYEGVSVQQARDLAEYVGGRGSMLLGQRPTYVDDPDEKRERDTYRAAVRLADTIYEMVGRR